MMNQPPRSGHGGGQALTEFLVISLALIPLFLLVPMIGKYQDISHATQMASRYAAFDAVLRNDSHNSSKPTAQLEGELRQRFLGPAGAAVITEAKEGPALRENWNDPYGHALIRDPGDVALSFGAARRPAHADGYTAAGDTTIFPLAPLADLPGRGIYRANVAVTVANLPAGLRSVEPFDQLNLRIERHASVLPDPWTASAPARTEARAGKLAPINEKMPGAMIAAVIRIVELDSVPPPAFGDLERWRDVVPADRLRPAVQP